MWVYTVYSTFAEAECNLGNGQTIHEKTGQGPRFLQKAAQKSQTSVTDTFSTPCSYFEYRINQTKANHALSKLTT